MQILINLFIDLNRTVNLISYLNKSWKFKWGGSLEVYNKSILQKLYMEIDATFNIQ